MSIMQFTQENGKRLGLVDTSIVGVVEDLIGSQIAVFTGPGSYVTYSVLEEYDEIVDATQVVFFDKEQGVWRAQVEPEPEPEAPPVRHLDRGTAARQALDEILKRPPNARH